MALLSSPTPSIVSTSNSELAPVLPDGASWQSTVQFCKSADGSYVQLGTGAFATVGPGNKEERAGRGGRGRGAHASRRWPVGPLPLPLCAAAHPLHVTIAQLPGIVLFEDEAAENRDREERRAGLDQRYAREQRGEG
jgi:hypothetical protein